MPEASETALPGGLPKALTAIQGSDGIGSDGLHHSLPFRALVERVQQGAAILDGHGDITYCNRALADLVESTQENLAGAPLRRFIEPEDEARFQALLRKAQSGPCESELRLRRAGCTLVPAHFALWTLPAEKPAIGILITDLTVQRQQGELALRLQLLQDAERRRLARELHDSVGQLLVAIAMNIAKVQREAHKLHPETGKLVHENAALLEQINTEVRTISHLLHPPLLDEVGLSSALRWYVDGFAERSKIDARLEIPQDFDRLPQAVELTIFRAVQEALTNVHRHSGSPSCVVKLSREAECVYVEIRDAGRGIPVGKLETLRSSAGVGLRGLQERFRQLGGTLEIASNANGTTVTAALPLSQARGGDAEAVA
jgi:PAS domain S-box-containing protein